MEWCTVMANYIDCGQIYGRHCHFTPLVSVCACHTHMQLSFRVVLKDTCTHRRAHTHTLLILCCSVPFPLAKIAFSCLISLIVSHHPVAGDDFFLKPASTHLVIHPWVCCVCVTGWLSQVRKTSTFSLGRAWPYHSRIPQVQLHTGVFSGTAFPVYGPAFELFALPVVFCFLALKSSRHYKSVCKQNSLNGPIYWKITRVFNL